MNYIRYEVTIKYTRHPFDKLGEPVKDKTEVTTWFDTIYQESKRPLSEMVAKAIAKRRFMEKMSHIKINTIRAVKQTYKEATKTWV